MDDSHVVACMALVQTKPPKNKMRCFCQSVVKVRPQEWENILLVGRAERSFTHGTTKSRKNNTVLPLLVELFHRIMGWDHKKLPSSATNKQTNLIYNESKTMICRLYQSKRTQKHTTKYTSQLYIVYNI